MEPDFTVTTGASAGLTRSPDGVMETLSDSGTVLVQLWHGTDQETALWIAEHGVNYDRMIQYLVKYSNGRKINPDYFWTTRDRSIALDYAHLNNAVNMSGIPPALFKFSLPLTVMTGLANVSPPLAGTHSQEDADFLFSPECFTTINSEMTEVSVTLAADLKIDE